MSDRCSRGETADLSGPAILEWAERLGAVVSATELVPDDTDAIVRGLLKLTGCCDVALTTGGTGFTPRDVTPEATRVVIEREAPGIAELLRLRGIEKTPYAVMSRGVAGVRGTTLIVNLPGSPKAVRESLEALEPSLLHLVAMLKGMGDHH